MFPGFIRNISKNGKGWYWEVVANGDQVVARGLADTAQQAADEAAKAELVVLSQPTPLRL